jgi:hypothetical protein
MTSDRISKRMTSGATMTPDYKSAGMTLDHISETVTHVK